MTIKLSKEFKLTNNKPDAYVQTLDKDLKMKSSLS